ncbi:UDP-forming cellulose synthase catalytic subunit [Roseococcus sp. YIM B11640]|uniref:UDP-forming cellulose synthase catalytic subunit n=1 Tax=Roseococcus sp. YIM B11640 TaxID=3133973 RepID=UPI003C7A5227
MRNKWFGWLVTIVGLTAALVVITVPMQPEQQAIFAIGGFIVFLIFNRLEGRTVTLLLALLSIVVSLRYIFWRVTETLDFSTFLQTFLGTGLLLAEVYAIVALVLAYFQTLWPLDRKPAPMPANPDDWPVVDVFIPSYNEPLDIVRPTVFAALALDWPPEKLNVYLLDDGRREDFRRFAAEVGCGYIIRPDNRGAKAGNINHALSQTTGEYVVVFDCDHVATRGFLQLTVGWMLRDRGLAMVQTPHYFYSPDPFERNLVAGQRVPNEGLLFYGLIQQGNDFWGATFFCGSCAVMRRTALEAVGGVPTQTVTEDCHCSLKMQKLGWRTAYLRVPLAAGLATERLMLHIGQRMRWARGMIQILRIENPLTSHGLNLAQRLCYFMAMFHFLFPLPRFVFLTAPLAFLIFGESIIAASPLAIVAYAGPHIVHSVVTNSRIQRRVRHSFWSEIYETVLTVYLLPVTLATLLDPKRGRFNVTDKGGTLEEGYFDLRAVGPNMFLAGALIFGLLLGIYGLAVNPPASLEFQAYALNVVWATFCLITVLAGLAVGRERRQVRERARVAAEVSAAVTFADGRRIEGVSEDLSLGGAALRMPAPETLGEEPLVMVELDAGSQIVSFPAEVLRWQGDRLNLRFLPQDIQDEGNVVIATLSRADAWVDWDNIRADRPLRSLKEVLVSIGGLFSGGSQFSFRRRPARGRIINAEPLAPPAPPVSARNENARTAVTAAVSGAVMLLMASTALAQTRVPGSALGTGGGNVPAAPTLSPLPGSAGGPAPSAPPLAPAPAAPVLSPSPTLPPILSPAPAAAPAQPPMLSPAPTLAPAGGNPLAPAGGNPLAPAAPAGGNPLAPAGGAPNAGPMDLNPLMQAAGQDAPGTRTETRTLRQLGLRGPMQLRGVSDLQGILFGVRGDEVVTSARLVLQGATSPALIPELSQIAFTVNEQFVGTVQPDRSRPAFGPLEFPINPFFFADVNRLNFRFTGRYAIECNDPLSGLLWSTISDNSTLSLRLERLPVTRDLARLPEPFFDPRLLREPLVLPMIMQDTPSNDALRAAAIVSSWFAVQADYRGATFPVATVLPPTGNAVVITTAPDAIPGLILPRLEGPTLAVVQNPSDPLGLLLVIAGRNGGEAVTAATALGVGREALSGEIATITSQDVPARQPYDAPRWVRTDRPLRFGEIMDPSELQAFGYVPGPIAVPFRTAPDLYTARERALSSLVRFRAPPGPIMDVAVSRLDVAINDIYLRSVPLRAADLTWPLSWIQRQFVSSEVDEAQVALPSYMLFGQNELQLRFDMRPLHRGDCIAVPGDIRASVDPDSTIDLTGAHRFTTLPNLAFFTSSGFPYTRLADLGDTAVVLPERPSQQELESFLTLMGRISALVGYPPVRMQVIRPGALQENADKDLIVIGTLGRQPALQTLMREAGPLRVEGNRLSVALNDGMGDFRNLFGGERRGELERLQAQLAAPGESLGALIGFESPLKSGRSVVALTGSSPAGLEAMIIALRDPEQVPRVQGDTAVLSGGRVTAYRVTSTYQVGSLPPWLWPEFYLGNNPWYLLIILLVVLLLVPAPLYWILRRRAAQRLRERSAV